MKVSETKPLSSVASRVLRVGPTTTFIKEGLSTAEVLRLLGEPIGVATRDDSGTTISTYEFTRGGGRVLTAEFIDEVLVRSHVNVRS